MPHIMERREAHSSLLVLPALRFANDVTAMINISTYTVRYCTNSRSTVVSPICHLTGGVGELMSMDSSSMQSGRSTFASVILI